MLCWNAALLALSAGKCRWQRSRAATDVLLPLLCLLSCVTSIKGFVSLASVCLVEDCELLSRNRAVDAGHSQDLARYYMRR
jgi:hypothetical protein